MSRTHTLRQVSLALVITTMGLAAPSMAAKNDVIIVPARARILALAFDVYSLRGGSLVTYRGNAMSTAPLLHAWNTRRGEWQEMTLDEFTFGKFMPSPPDNLYIIGTASDVPPGIIDGAMQARKVIRIETLNMAETANAFHVNMKFSQREWRSLADRHGLQTKDLNYERRRWGRFGPPGTHHAASPPAIEPVPALDDELPPATEDAVIAEAPPPVVVATPPVVFIPDASAHQPLEPEEIPAAIDSTPAVEGKGMPAPVSDTPPQATPVFETLAPEDK